MYNRTYSDLHALNTEAIAWLGRTANFLPHNFTKKSPHDEHLIEKKYLNAYRPLTIENKQTKMYHVRKTNTIAYKSNFYTLPMGTYTKSGTQVLIKEKENILEIYNLKEELICSHELSLKKGQTIANTHHRRDTSKRVSELINQIVLFFSTENEAQEYLQKIKEQFPRYSRDHFQVILKALADTTKHVADKTLDFCLKNKLFNAYEFEQVLHVFLLETLAPEKKQTPIKLLNETNLEKASQSPQASNIEDYETIINQ